MYKDYLSINKNFQTSINLQLDLGNKNKIEEYIPTTDICNILKQYFRTFLGKDKNKSTTLVGPYGKGKSFLLLVLTYLTNANANSEIYTKLRTKIKGVDKELYLLIDEFHSQGMRFLPVIINSNYDDLTQSFRVALDQSLTLADISDIVPNSTYKICLSLLDNWQNDATLVEKLGSQCKQEAGNLEKLRKGLKDYSVKAYEAFKNIYRCMTMGIEFNPLVNDDIVNTYSNVLRELNVKHRYTGIFLIFDEFSKFINNATNISRDLKLIQDFAELANRTPTGEQIDFCCVTHKSLNLYTLNDSKVSRDTFKTVEGRFKEVKFNRSLEENYQIISGAIFKKDYSKVKSAAHKYEKLFLKIRESGIFPEETDFESLNYGCFPLNPITTYSLIQLSEKIAQNERTLFTFLSDADENSFNSFLNRNSEGTLNVDSLYDYFSSIMQSSEDEKIRNIWFRAEAILSKNDELAQRKIIKCIAIFSIIDDFDKLPCNTGMLSLALNEKLDVIKTNVSALLQNHLLKTDDYETKLFFASSNSKEIDDQINMLLKTKLSNASVSTLLSQFNEEKFILPRRYNEEKKITRFYRVDFLSVDELLNLKSFNSLFEKEYSDGLVINVLGSKEAIGQNREKIEQKTLGISDSRVIVRLPASDVDDYFINSIKKCEALRLLSLQGNSADDLKASEIKLMYEETIVDINKHLSSIYNANSVFTSILKGHNDFTYTLSELMNDTFPKCLKFNNELINKNVLTSQYQKVVNRVVDFVLSPSFDIKKPKNLQEILRVSETSPEQSVYDAVVNPFVKNDSEYTKDVKNLIRSEIISSETGAVLVRDISKRLSDRPFGVRKGLHSLLLSLVIVSLNNSNVVLKLQSKEVDLNAENLQKAVYSSSEYSISYSKSSEEQREYISKIFKLFDVKTTDNFRTDIKETANQIRHFFLSLPKIVRNMEVNNDFLGLDKKILLYKSFFLSFNINAFDVVLMKPLSIFDNYQSAYLEISKFVSDCENEGILAEYKSSVESLIKDVFGVDSSSSLKAGIQHWKRTAVPENTMLVLDNLDSKIYNVIESFSYNEEENINVICHEAVGNYIQDWEVDNKEKLSEVLKSFKEHVENASSLNLEKGTLGKILSTDFDEITPLGHMLKDNIMSSFEEFGDSISKEEKIAIISEILKEIM